LFDATDFITVVDDFPLSNLTIPTISVVADTIVTSRFELGNRKRLQTRTWYIDVFAKNKSQRDEYAYRILNALEECVPVYNYDEGFPPIIPTRLGCLEPEEIRMEIITILPELVDKLYYRSTVTYSSVYNQF
jgi:hypothetical protein